MNPPLSRSTHVEQIERLEARVAALEARNNELEATIGELPMSLTYCPTHRTVVRPFKSERPCCVHARVAALTAALEAQCFEHADNCCDDWCDQCRQGRQLKIAALDAAAGHD